MPPHNLEPGPRRPGLSITWITLGVVLIALLFGARTMATYTIEVEWRKELGQFHTWLRMLWYSVVPQAVATLLALGALGTAHARALRFARTSLREHRIYARITALALLGVSYVVAAASIDTWTVVRFAGSRGLPAAATAWHDAVFQKPLSFYLFDLPFYDLLRGYLLAVVILCILVYWIAARGWQIALDREAWVQRMRNPDRPASELTPGLFRLEGGLESKFLRIAAAVFLLAMALALLPGSLSDGLQRARLLPGGHRLRRFERRASPAVAADRGLSGRRGPGPAGALDLGRLDGGCRWWWPSWSRTRWPRST